ncbi:hypothetical protein A3D77_07920 [Candidatus Gottesmanbacteria bacterium RIFCSPHIGHO2_02_FULL_39_11]|uniref:NAD(P)-binding domain-containing protein n=1 Tax=Candidatus Gottesmanbacteria bacterium RIFCSPHIGHO2_02_FULL_39_11 TaxID=1798382 RepID=A0A1F5ZM64_9BACT|nr:MAG: hypothetical protein A3D77_07920 [Candidatus Gottesmanbacteria bacterium RIFCSPHIGHO2_02_FULL_39_11]
MKNAHLASKLRDAHILITGGLGFIGSNLAIELVKRGSKILIIDALIPGYGGNLINVVGYGDGYGYGGIWIWGRFLIWIWGRYGYGYGDGSDMDMGTVLN